MICCNEHICAASLQYGLFGTVSSCQLQRMTCRTELEGASLDKQLCQMICHIVHIHATSLHCELEDAFSGGQPHQMIFCSEHICAPFHHCEWASGSSDERLGQMIYCIGHIYVASLHYEWLGGPSGFGGGDLFMNVVSDYNVP